MITQVIAIILCTTFPIFQITRNVVNDYRGTQVNLMISAQLGCPHDYILTPQDMHKISSAQVLIINGLGMEEFMGSYVKKANPDIKIIDSSNGIKEIIGSNPHLFASPMMCGKLALNIADSLSSLFPDGAQIFLKNAKAYAGKMQKLSNEMINIGKKLKNNRIVTQHEVFDYLAKDIGLEIVALIQAHSENKPSAADIIKIVEIIKNKNAGAIFLEPQYPEKIGRTIAIEARIPVSFLDPAATGPFNAPLDYYEKIMRQNLETLVKTLGVK